jgi:hypothetical protein
LAQRGEIVLLVGGVVVVLQVVEAAEVRMVAHPVVVEVAEIQVVGHPVVMGAVVTG